MLDFESWVRLSFTHVWPDMALMQRQMLHWELPYLIGWFVTDCVVRDKYVVFQANLVLDLVHRVKTSDSTSSFASGRLLRLVYLLAIVELEDAQRLLTISCSAIVCMSQWPSARSFGSLGVFNKVHGPTDRFRIGKGKVVKANQSKRLWYNIAMVVCT